MQQSRVDISALNPAERLELIERLWDSLSPPEEVPVTDAQRAELASRVAALERGEMKVIPLEEAITAIRAGRAARHS
jgi:putative addiction module component (TIGR02574 family)